MSHPDPPTRIDEGHDLIAAVGRASEALEYVERARGHLYSFHQLIGRADLLFEEAAELLRDLGDESAANELSTEVVGRNVLDGRWTFQVVDEFDRGYWAQVTFAVRELERVHSQGKRHLHESRMKDQRRTPGAPGHERRPAPRR